MEIAVFRERRRGRRGNPAGFALAAILFSVVSVVSAAAHGSQESSGASGVVPITFWEAYNGPVGSDLAHLVDRFNASQTHYRVSAVYKGSYPEVLSATIAAYRAHKAPDIAMVFDVGTATMMYSKGVYVPVYALMTKNGIPFSTGQFIGGAASYYENRSGRLDSLPFASSTPVLFYNKRMLASVGAQPPKTWKEVGATAGALVSKGVVRYGFTTAAPTWTQFEQFSVWNDYHYATRDNGYNGPAGVRLLINTAPFVDHVQRFAQWERSGAFFYGGRHNNPQSLFVGGKVAMYTGSSADYAAIAAGAKFPFGESPLPYDGSSNGAPQNTVVGGNSLWVIAGAQSRVYPGVAGFLHFLTRPSSQTYWAAKTGYVPVTKAAVRAIDKSGFYATHPYAHVAVAELTNKEATPWSRGIRLGDMPQIRSLESAAFTAAVAGKESAQTALDAAERQGNKVLAIFASEHGG